MRYVKTFLYLIILFLTSCYSVKTNNNSIVINEVVSRNSGSSYDINGKSSDWIEIYNSGKRKINLEGYSLSVSESDNPIYLFNKSFIRGGETLIIWCSANDSVNTDLELHAPFKISGSGEVITLTDPDGKVVDKIEVPELDSDVSFGRPISNIDQLVILSNSTPGKLNNSDERLNDTQSTIPLFSTNGGFYATVFNLELSCLENEVIYYTTDGSIPTLDSNLYKNSIKISDASASPNELSTIEGTAVWSIAPKEKLYKGSVIRAITYSKGHPISDVVTNTYFISDKLNKRYSMPVVSISTNSENLFDFNRGIYMLGKINKDWVKNSPKEKIQGDNPANFNQRGKGWAIPFHMEYYDLDGKSSLSNGGLLRILGGWSRANPVKSLRLDFNEPIKNIIYPDLDIKELNSIVLRTGANDWDHTIFRDTLMTSIVDDLMETQESKPAIVFINGEYWGIHNIRERMNQSYFKNHFNIPIKNIVVLENEGEVAEGDSKGAESYKKILDFIENNDLSITTNYEYIKSKIDIENFVDYFATQIYYANSDWPGNNIRFWHDEKNDSKWRWMLYDTDFGLGLYDWTGGVHHDTFDLVMNPNGPDWPNPPWSTLLFRSLISNSDFKLLFLNRFCDLLNSRFSTINMKKELNEIIELYEPEMTEHLNRWGNPNDNLNRWKSKTEIISGFVSQRPKLIREKISRKFGLKGSVKLEINIKNGSVNVNTINNLESNWSGVYFKNTAITIKAIPNEGYTFTGWEGLTGSTNPVIQIKLDKNSILTPLFVKDDK
ncbi:MAG: CotH kinase family protein [Spirochaetaceae bacterium]